MDRSARLAGGQLPEDLSRALVDVGAAYAVRALEGESDAHQNYGKWQDFVGRMLARLDDPFTRLPTSAEPPVDRELLWDYVDAWLFRDIDVALASLRGRWFPICRVELVAAPGTYRTVQWFHENLVVRRLPDDTIAVSANVCPHRQAPVFIGQGSATSAQCYYHGWRFGLDGQCQDIPLSDTFDGGIRCHDFALQELPSCVADDWVHVGLPPRGDGPIRSFERPSARHVDVEAALADQLYRADTTYEHRRQVGEPQIPYVWRLLFRVGATHARLQQLLSGASPRWRGRGDGGRQVALARRIDLRQALLVLHAHVADIEDWPEWELAFHAPPSLAPPPVDERAVEAQLQDLPTSEPQATLPIWTFGNEQVFSLEVDELVRKHWQFVCHESEIADPGDHSGLTIVGERVYAYRAGDGTVRGGRWRVDDPAEPPAEGMWRHALEPIDVLVSKGFVFVRLDEDGPDLVWEMPHIFDLYRSRDLRPIDCDGWVDFVADTDYKVIWDNFNETLHFPTTHPLSWKLFEYSLYYVKLRSSPSPGLDDAQRTYYDAIVEAATHDREREEQLLRQFVDHETLDEPLQYGHLSLAPHQLYSSTCLGITLFPDHFHIIACTPAGSRSCYVRSRCYGLPLDPTQSRDRALLRARRVNTDILGLQLTLEDMNITNRAQASYRSRVFSQRGVLSELEVSIGEFNRNYRRWLPVSRFRQQPPVELLRALHRRLKQPQGEPDPVAPAADGSHPDR